MPAIVFFNFSIAGYKKSYVKRGYDLTNKKASRQAKDMKERLSFLETVIGYNAESERNGNGIISLLDNLFEKMKASEDRIDRLDNRSSNRYNELNNKIEKIEQTLDTL